MVCAAASYSEVNGSSPFTALVLRVGLLPLIDWSSKYSFTASFDMGIGNVERYYLHASQNDALSEINWGKVEFVNPVCIEINFD